MGIHTQYQNKGLRGLASTTLNQESRSNGTASLKELVVRDIIRGLYEGRYVPGQRLIEAELTVVYGTSRSTIREALNRLTAMGVVELVGQRGGQICTLTVEEAVDTLIIAEGLLKIAARVAALRVERPGNRDRLLTALEQIKQCDPSRNFGESGLVRDRFYSALTDISNVAGLARVLTSLRAHVVRVEYRNILLQADQYRYYKRIADAILAGNSKAAEGAIKTQMRNAINALLDYRKRILGKQR